VLCTVCAVRVVRYSSTPTPLDVQKQYDPCSGYLHDGRIYVVYRVLQSAKASEVLICFQWGFLLRKDYGYGAARYICLTPPQVSSNEIIQYIIQDIVKCSTIGVRGVDPWGNSVTIFIDVIGYIGDYPAVTRSLDFIGRNSLGLHVIYALLSAKIESDRLIYLTLDIPHLFTAKLHISAAQLTG
jgi:hypothetical protein